MRLCRESGHARAAAACLCVSDGPRVTDTTVRQPWVLLFSAPARRSAWNDCLVDHVVVLQEVLVLCLAHARRDAGFQFQPVRGATHGATLPPPLPAVRCKVGGLYSQEARARHFARPTYATRRIRCEGSDSGPLKRQMGEAPLGVGDVNRRGGEKKKNSRVQHKPLLRPPQHSLIVFASKWQDGRKCMTLLLRWRHDGIWDAVFLCLALWVLEVHVSLDDNVGLRRAPPWLTGYPDDWNGMG